MRKINHAKGNEFPKLQKIKDKIASRLVAEQVLAAQGDLRLLQMIS